MSVPYINFNDVPPLDMLPSVPRPPCEMFPAVPHARQARDFYEIFLKGKPRVLGTLQIVIGFLQIALGVTAAFVLPFCYSSSTGNNFWGPLSFVAAGCLSNVAVTKRSIDHVKGSLALNTCIIFISAVGITLTSLDMKIYERYIYFIYGSESRIIAIVWLLIITNVLQFSLCIPVLIAGCCSVSHNPIGTPEVYVLPNYLAFAPPPPYSTGPPPVPEAPPRYSDLY